MKKSKSSHEWLRRHEDDEYVRRARAAGYRSRASYKLLEVDDRYGLLAPGAVVVDLGAAPGGWCQVVQQRVGASGRVIGVDLLPVEPLAGVSLLQGDFTEDAICDELLMSLQGRAVDLVLSDMAPNLSGMKAIDQPRAALLVELALDFARQTLRPGGSLVCKCFEGQGVDGIRQAYQELFAVVSNFKPKASRAKSRELYIIGRQFQGAGAGR